LKACCSFTLKLSRSPGNWPRTRRMAPISSSRAASIFSLSATFTCNCTPRRPPNILENAEIGIMTWLSEAEEPRNSPCLAKTPITVHGWPSIFTTSPREDWRGTAPRPR